MFVGKKTASDTSDLAPEVWQRRLVLKRQRHANGKNKKLVAVITDKKQTLQCAYCAYCAFFSSGVDSRAYVQCTPMRTHNNYYILRKWWVVVFCFPSSNKKTDEQTFPSVFFFSTEPAAHKNVEFCSFHAGGTFWTLTFCGLPLAKYSASGKVFHQLVLIFLPSSLVKTWRFKLSWKASVTQLF